MFSHLKISPFTLCWLQLGLCLVGQEHLCFAYTVCWGGGGDGNGGRVFLGLVPWGSCKIFYLEQQHTHKGKGIQANASVSFCFCDKTKLMDKYMFKWNQAHRFSFPISKSIALQDTINKKKIYLILFVLPVDVIGHFFFVAEHVVYHPGIAQGGENVE